jgi:1,2-dihydroxy-3-keto-5-methylthiopentene dioxygenase
MQLWIHDAEGALRAHHEGVDAVRGAGAPLGLHVGQLAVSAGPAGEPPAVREPAALAALHRRFGIGRADRLRVPAGDGRWPALRRQGRRRHSHAEREVRLFLQGQGLFELQLPDGGQARLLVQAGDWLALPPHRPHAFDGGAAAGFDVLRLYATELGKRTLAADDADSAPPPDLDRVLASLGRPLAEVV